MDNRFFVAICCEALKIKKPVQIKFKTKGTGEFKSCAGLYITRYRKNSILRHDITINLDSVIHAEYNLNGVIAHELIHACQEEHNLWKENGKHHNKKFQDIAKVLETCLAEYGFETGPIYSPLTDTE